MTKNRKKILQLENFFSFFSKTTIYLSVGLHKGRPSYKRSLQFSKENIQHFKINFFLLLWVIFALVDPEPNSEYESGSTDPTESG
jgi:hypothetical protein